MRRKRRHHVHLAHYVLHRKQAHISLQEEELEFWRAYAKELEGTFDGLENRLIEMESAHALDNRKN